MTGINQNVFSRAFGCHWDCVNCQRFDGDMAEWSLWHQKILSGYPPRHSSTKLRHQEGNYVRPDLPELSCLPRTLGGYQIDYWCQQELMLLRTDFHTWDRRPLTMRIMRKTRPHIGRPPRASQDLAVNLPGVYLAEFTNLCHQLCELMQYLLPKQGSTPQILWSSETTSYSPTTLRVHINGLHWVPAWVKWLYRHTGNCWQTHEASNICSHPQFTWCSQSCPTIYPESQNIEYQTTLYQTEGQSLFWDSSNHWP